MRVLALVGVALVAVNAIGAGAQTPVAAASTPLDAFDQIVAARVVADFARRQKDATAMIVAARMVQEVPLRDAPGTDSAGGFGPRTLLEEAKGFAKGDVALLTQISIASANSRGVFSSAFGKGLVRSVQDVAPRSSYRFALNAAGGTPLKIGAIGDLGTSMTMRLTDTGGRLVCSDDRGDYAPVCGTTPPKAATYRVELLNRSPKSSRTVILSN